MYVPLVHGYTYVFTLHVCNSVHSAVVVADNNENSRTTTYSVGQTTRSMAGILRMAARASGLFDLARTQKQTTRCEPTEKASA